MVDCIEFNRRFRFADVCADVAFLAMDLTSRRRPDLAEAFLAAYARASQDYDLYPLVDFYESYRAFVRAKVASFVAHADGTPEPVRRHKNEEAREHFLLALSGARRQLLPPRLVAVGGWIAAGWKGEAMKSLFLHQDPVAVYPQTLFSPPLHERQVDHLCFWFWWYLRQLSRNYDATAVSGEWFAQRLAALEATDLEIYPYSRNNNRNAFLGWLIFGKDLQSFQCLFRAEKKSCSSDCW